MFPLIKEFKSTDLISKTMKKWKTFLKKDQSCGEMTYMICILIHTYMFVIQIVRS